MIALPVHSLQVSVQETLRCLSVTRLQSVVRPTKPKASPTKRSHVVEKATLSEPGLISMV